jgi:AraC family transcriptional regulator
MSSGLGVPVSMGSPRFDTVEWGGFLVTSAVFPSGYKIAKHFHDRPVVGLTLAGEWNSVLGATRLANHAGTLHVEPAGDCHVNHFDSKTRVVIVQPDPLDARLAGSFRSLLETGCQIQVGLQGILIAERLRSELSRPDNLTSLAIESLAVDLLVSARRAEPPRAGSTPSWLARSVAYLHARFLQRPTLDDLAGVAGVSTAHFTREFRRWYRMGPAEYVRRLRLDWAAERLRHDSESLAQIASASGFADQSHFTRYFRRQFGATPGAFRAASRKA